MRELQISNLTAHPGEKVSGFVPIIGADFGIPVTLICGAEEGETVLISGGLHNAEYVGIQAAMELADTLDPAKIKGNVVVIRLMNRTGFEHRTMSLVYEDGKNLNRIFPGAALGSLGDKIAHTIVTEFFSKTDYFIDLHCGDGFEGLASHVYCQGAASEEVKAKSRALADIAHVDFLYESSVSTGGAYNYAGTIGIPGIILERGSNSIWCQDQVAEDVHDVKNMLRFLGVLKGKSHCHAKKPVQVNPGTWEDAPVSGCWYPSKQAGETFKEGEVLGVIRDYFGKELHVCRAKHGGVLLYQTISLFISEGSPMVAYGTWDEDTQGKIEKGCLACGEEHGAHGHGHHHGHHGHAHEHTHEHTHVHEHDGHVHEHAHTHTHSHEHMHEDEE